MTLFFLIISKLAYSASENLRVLRSRYPNPRRKRAKKPFGNNELHSKLKNPCSLIFQSAYWALSKWAMMGHDSRSEQKGQSAAFSTGEAEGLVLMHPCWKWTLFNRSFYFSALVTNSVSTCHPTTVRNKAATYNVFFSCVSAFHRFRYFSWICPHCHIWDTAINSKGEGLWN